MKKIFYRFPTYIILTIEKKTWICHINFGEGVDSQWYKVDPGVSTVAEGEDLCFEGNEV